MFHYMKHFVSPYGTAFCCICPADEQAGFPDFSKLFAEVGLIINNGVVGITSTFCYFCADIKRKGLKVWKINDR